MTGTDSPTGCGSGRRESRRRPDKTFRVGVIYGPSGCGKSSLVKAGLLPLLRKHVRRSIRGDRRETEARLLRGMRKAFPDLAGDQGLVETFVALRRGLASRRAARCSWSWTSSSSGSSPGATSRRPSWSPRCDSATASSFQALCLVRDDFWMAATRFMRDLEIDLVPDRNIAAVDLFEPKHARKVLAAFGRAYGAAARGRRPHQGSARFPRPGRRRAGPGWPGRAGAAGTLRRDGQGQALDARDLERGRRHGGRGRQVPRGDLLLSSVVARHRYHQKAAQAVLKSLLPETNADIKGRMRSIEELREVSGYSEQARRLRRPDPHPRQRPRFDHAGRPLQLDRARRAGNSSGRRSLLPAHARLPGPLAAGLVDQKQRETRRGRAELLLAELRALWNAKPERFTCPRPESGSGSGS